MRKIKIKDIIKAKGLNTKEVARQLFPNNKYPDLALARIVKGLNTLNTDQLSKFADMAGLSIAELFDDWSWKAITKQDLFIFTNGEFTAELNRTTWMTKIFHKNSLFHESVIHSGSTPLSEYFDELNKLINKFKK